MTYAKQNTESLKELRGLQYTRENPNSLNMKFISRLLVIGD